MVTGRMHFRCRSARLACGGRLNRNCLFFRDGEVGIAEGLDKRIAGALRFENPFLGLSQSVQKFSRRDFIFYGCLGLVHADHERKFAKADWSGGELAGGKERGGNDQQSTIISGAFHNPRVLPEIARR